MGLCLLIWSDGYLEEHAHYAGTDCSMDIGWFVDNLPGYLALYSSKQYTWKIRTIEACDEEERRFASTWME